MTLSQIMRFFFHFGRYLLLLRQLFKKPENYQVYREELFRQMVSIGVKSTGIVVIISIFMGAVTTVQTAYQLITGLVSRSVIGGIVSDSSILELGPTITSLVLAGKIGSSIASEIGTMRVTEQIDALEIMGVNAPGYLISPKIVAAIVTIPMLIVLSIALSIGGGIFVGDLTGILSSQQFIDGARASFLPYNIFFSMSKAFTFAFIISSVSAYQGYFTSGGSLEVGQSSTRAVVFSCILILLADYLLAQILL
jgi:phospholipid/cholesterol/gamma-HCH transport system permease protein